MSSAVFDVTHPEVLDIVKRALAEDVGTGDITTNLCVPAERIATAQMIARQHMVVAGVELFPLILAQLGPVENVDIAAPSGTKVNPGTVLATVKGPARTLLTAERTSLNFVQRLSGVATTAAHYTSEVVGTRCKVLDTRKTTPGLRRLEKMAAAAGGITNHRMGLFDAVLIKNNHIAAAGGVTAALKAAAGATVPVEIEVRTLDELDEALEAGAKNLLLDNVTPGQARDWIARIAGRATVEVSGGVTIESVRAYAEAGADFISCGAITHSAKAMDINLRLHLD